MYKLALTFALLALHSDIAPIIASLSRVHTAYVIGWQELKWRGESGRLRKTKNEMAIQMATVSQVNVLAFWRWLNTFSMSMCSHN